MTAHATGSEAWWQAKQAQGIPDIVCGANGDCNVTFWWRDPTGSEESSRVQRVWLYITGLTDHHKPSRPQSLTRVPGTDAWRWQITLNARWRGSYCLIPSERTDDFAPEVFAGEAPDRAALREGWGKLLPCAIADPFNPTCWRGGRGHPVSALHLPDAPPQPGWDKPQTPHHPPRCIQWRSHRLANSRRIWVFTTGEAQPEQRPLAILLDGQFWAESQPIFPALQALTNDKTLPPAVYLLIDVIDPVHRSHELPCNADFWLAVQEELLPQVQAIAPWRDEAATTVVAGQSFGGLAALYAGLNWPQRFGNVLSQSGSFWWPNRGGAQDGWLVEQLVEGRLDARPLRIFLEAGIHEPLIHQANQRLHSLLHTQQPLFWRQVDGGHDALCWRGGLTEGLCALWRPLTDPQARI